MKTGMNLLLWTDHVTEAQDVIIDQIKVLGFDAAEIPVFATSDLAPYQRLGKRLKSLGLGATAVTVMGPETNPISSDRKIRDAAVAHLDRVDGVRPAVRLRDPLRAAAFGDRRFLRDWTDRGRVQVRRGNLTAGRRESTSPKHRARHRVPEPVRELLPHDHGCKPCASSAR